MEPKKIFLRGEGRVTNNSDEAIEPVEDKEPEFQSDAVEYNAGVNKKNPLSELVEEEANVPSSGVDGDAIELPEDFEEVEVVSKSPEVIDARTAPIDQLIPKSTNPGFDETMVQDARKDTGVEGGVTNPLRSTGPMKFNGDSSSEGGAITKGPLSDATKGAFELSGFHVESQTDTGMVSVQITQDFSNMETAKASVNGDKYLMPLRSGGFKLCRITRGAPIICYEERQILEYINNEWRRP